MLFTILFVYSTFRRISIAPSILKFVRDWLYKHRGGGWCVKVGALFVSLMVVFGLAYT